MPRLSNKIALNGNRLLDSFFDGGPAASIDLTAHHHHARGQLHTTGVQLQSEFDIGQP